MQSRKRKADDEDDVAAEAHRRAQSTVPSPSPPSPFSSLAAAAAASSSSSRSPAEDGQSTAEHVAANMHGASSPSDSTAVPSTTAAAAPPPPPTATPSSSSAMGAASAVQAPHMAAASFHRLADVEVQLIIQQLDLPDLLRLARCSRSLLRCASHPFAWQWLPLPVDVYRSEVVEDDRRRAHSLLRFASSSVVVDANVWNSISLAALINVPQLAVLNFRQSSQTPILLTDWWSFLQHPNARRLTELDLSCHSTLCDDGSVALLSQLPLLRRLYLAVPTAASTSLLAPLVHSPSLTEIGLFETMDSSAAIPAPLEPLGRCTRLRCLGLHHLTLRVGQLSELFIQLAKAGGRLQELSLSDLHILPMDGAAALARDAACEALSLELGLAAPFLSHLHALMILGTGPVSLDYVPSLPSLQMLEVWVPLLPFASTLALLLRRLPQLCCTVQLFRFPGHPEWHVQNQAMLPQLHQLAQQCSRLVIKEQQ